MVYFFCKMVDLDVRQYKYCVMIHTYIINI